MGPEQAGQESPGLFDLERRTAQEQIAAAWQLHVEAIQEHLERGWKEQVARALNERFDALELAFEKEVERRAGERIEQESERAVSAALRAWSERLNQTARRLDQASNLEEWAAALLDGAFAFAPRVVLFSVAGGGIQYEDHRSAGALDLSHLASVRVPLAEAPAFQSVLDSLDAVISMSSAGELSAALSAALEGGEDKRVCLLPVIAGQRGGQRRAAAVLYVESGDAPVDINVLEVITALAGPALDARQGGAKKESAQGLAPVISIAPVIPPAPVAEEESPVQPPDWSALPREEQEIHARAQRFARVRVAEIRLYHAKEVREGREIGNIYAILKGEIDHGRAQFKHEFMNVRSMVDYFHLELLRTLANDDPRLLGPDYPGALA